MGNDFYAMKRIHNFFEMDSFELSYKERSLRVEYELFRSGMVVTSLVYIWFCRRQLRKIRTEAFPTLVPPLRITKFVKSLFAISLMWTSSFIIGSVYGIAYLKRRLIKLDQDNAAYYYATNFTPQQEPEPDYSESMKPPGLDKISPE